MVRFAARCEYARTVEDVLARRSRLLFLDASLAASLATEVGEILAQETGADPAGRGVSRLGARIFALARIKPLDASTILWHTSGFACKS